MEVPRTLVREDDEDGAKWPQPRVQTTGKSLETHTYENSMQWRSSDESKLTKSSVATRNACWKQHTLLDATKTVMAMEARILPKVKFPAING
mmetsp:Transcript_19749/g.54390  ORF Transcript_19749/g.54390 Transcript_19749/m.54390 type:complete len:92 (+) Transcript_19749:1980-2255(+)